MSQKPPLGRIAQSILEALKASPTGLDIQQLQRIADPQNTQVHFNRRLRDLYPHFKILRERIGSRIVYKYLGVRPKGEWDYAVISKTLQAKIRAKADGRCQMCGRTIKEDQVKLHIDHKIPAHGMGLLLKKIFGRFAVIATKEKRISSLL